MYMHVSADEMSQHTPRHAYMSPVLIQTASKGMPIYTTTVYISEHRRPAIFTHARGRANKGEK